jgi:hypothetical protein
MSSSDSSFSSSFSSLASSTGAAPPAAAPPAAGAPPAPPVGTEASFSEPAAISCGRRKCQSIDTVVAGAIRDETNLVDVLALELVDESLEAVLIGLNANGLEDLLDVIGVGGGVATEAEEKVSGEMLHFGCGLLESAGARVSRCKINNFRDARRRRPGKSDFQFVPCSREQEKSITLTAKLGGD